MMTSEYRIINRRLCDAIAGVSSPQLIAENLYAELRRLARDFGMNPDIETFIRKKPNDYRVSWEAGPYQWAIGASSVLPLPANGKPIEPYYSFDLCIYE